MRVIFGSGGLKKLGTLAVDEGATRVLLVTDRGIVRAGHVQRALDSLREAGVETTVFDGVEENPTTRHVELGLQIAGELGIDFLVGLGGGSSMDCAKGINFLLTNGGRMEDYWGVGKATKPMLPLIAIPTTAGTGSEAQSFALIANPDTHQKMACGDKKALPRVAILDPELTATQPRAVAAATGIDAVAHAIETAGCRKRTEVSRALSQEAWKRLDRAFDFITSQSFDEVEGDISQSQLDEARADMLLGAHLAGAAIEASMLGAAHSCANPLTSVYNIPHGVAVGLMLPHVIRFNAAENGNPYSDLCSDEIVDAETLAGRVEKMLQMANLPTRLKGLGVSAESLHRLASEAAKQWTAHFNPRPVGEEEFLDLYHAAYD